MIKIKKYKFSIIYLIILISFTIYLILDTFVFKESIQEIEVKETKINEEIKSTSTENSYKDENIEIKITTYREYDTDIYVADIYLNSPEYLKTAFANNTYGKNITSKTSAISETVNSILSINGDYYGVQETGYVLKNGIIYRDIPKNNQVDLAIFKDGTFKIVNEKDISLQSLLDQGVYNVLSFGPTLINDSNVSVGKNDEVGKAMVSNPRTAIGIIGENHYVFVVSDGRTKESDGLTLYELATFMESLDVNIAYNLDGGGSSTMYFNGKVINNPTTTGRNISERSVSDIVYIGY